MVLFYLLLTHCLYLGYSTTIYWLPAYPCRTLLPSTSPLPIPLVLYYILIFYWLPAYPYISLLPYTGPLPMPMLLYYLLLPTTCTYGTQLFCTDSLRIPMVLYYILLAPSLFLWYSTTFYWHPAYPYCNILPSTGPLLIPTCMVLFYLPTVYPYCN